MPNGAAPRRERQTGAGRQGGGEAPDAGDYLFLRKNFLGRMTHMVNNPKNAPAAAKANINPSRNMA